MYWTNRGCTLHPTAVAWQLHDPLGVIHDIDGTEGQDDDIVVLNDFVSRFGMHIVGHDEDAMPLGPQGQSWSQTWQDLERVVLIELHAAFRDRRFRGASPEQVEMSRLLLSDEILRHGYGRGDASTLEAAYLAFTNQISVTVQVTVEVASTLAAGHMAHIAHDRFCDDIRVLLDRAAEEISFVIRTAREVPSAFDVPYPDPPQPFENIYQGPLSLAIAKAASAAAVDLAICLDVLAKLVDFTNRSSDISDRAIPKGAMHWSDVRKLKPKRIPEEVFESIVALTEAPRLHPLLLLRHDLVHNTTALDIERNVYWGRGTPAVSNENLGYVYVPWRDTEEGGQPIRSFGRSFFIGQERDLTVMLCDWLFCVSEMVVGVCRLLARV